MDFSEGILSQSRDARDQGVRDLKLQGSDQKALNKVKMLFFALWQDSLWITRNQLAAFYEVSVDSIDKNYQRNRDEFDIDGVRVLRGDDLKQAKEFLALTSTTSQEVIYTPAGALRMGFILRDSEIAKKVRTTAIKFIQGFGEKVGSEIVLQALLKSYPILSSLTKTDQFIVSAPYSKYWHKMKATFFKKFPDGGIPKMSSDEIRKEIQFLSTYTDNFKLQGVKELKYRLAGDVRGKYPGLISDTFSFDFDNQIGTAVIMFQFDALIIDAPYIEECISRRYIQIAKEDLKVHKAYLIFVSPFGATSYAEDYVKNNLISEYQGYVGVLTVKDLAQFLYAQAYNARTQGIIKGEITSEFSRLLNYSFPDPPQLTEQLKLDLKLNNLQ